jgi:hypothetical protein
MSQETYARKEPKKESLAKLWGNFGQATLPNNTWRAWEPLLEEFSDREVEEACQRIMRSDLQRAPKWSDFARFLPSARPTTRGPSTAHWGVDGQWGGDWAKVDAGYIETVCREMARCADKFHRESREEFFKMAKRRGVDLLTIQVKEHDFSLKRDLRP